MSTENRKFLQDMQVTRAAFGQAHYSIAGAEWEGRQYDKHDTLSLHPAPGVTLEISRHYNRAGFSWEWSQKVADGCYARYRAHADSVEVAAAAAIAYAPRLMTFSYLAETTWYELAEGRFYTVLDGEDAEVFKAIDGAGFYWNRYCSQVKPILEAIGSYQLSGTAKTPEAAMIACIEAPNRLKAACATLIASLREQEAMPDIEKLNLRGALEEIAYSNHTKTGLKEIAKAALFPTEEAA